MIIKVYCNCSCLDNIIVHPVIINTSKIVLVLVIIIIIIIIIIIGSTHRVVMANRPKIVIENTKQKHAY